MKELHLALDLAVTEAYGFRQGGNLLLQLPELNQKVALREAIGEEVMPPGLPPQAGDKSRFISDACVRFEE